MQEKNSATQFTEGKNLLLLNVLKKIFRSAKYNFQIEFVYKQALLPKLKRGAKLYGVDWKEFKANKQLNQFIDEQKDDSEEEGETF